MGGKSRKTGGVSKSLIDRIKSGKKLAPSTKPKKNMDDQADPFGLLKDVPKNT